MKIFVLILFIISLSIAPIFVFADCSKIGVTVVYINGIWENQEQAKLDKGLLQKKFLSYSNIDDVTFVNGYNPTHVLGFDDVIRSIMQAYGNKGVDYNLTNILLQLHTDLSTQKILLVGHSQGTFYTNIAYDYLINHGVDKNSIAVYNVGTPADSVAGNGKYLTSSTDEVINAIVRSLAEKTFANKPLPANITINIPKDTPDPQDGHSFSNVYLGLAPDRIIGDMDSEINNLTAEDSDKSECFKAPKTDIIYHIEDGGYQTIDQSLTYFGSTPTSPFKSPKQLADFGGEVFNAIYNFGKSLFSGINTALAKIGPVAFVTSTLPGYSIQESKIPNPPQVQNVPAPVVVLIPTSPQENEQDLLDDIREKIDIINARVQILVAQQNHPVIQPDAPSDDGVNPDSQKKDNDQSDNNQDDNQKNTDVNSASSTVCTGQININTATGEDLDKITQVGPATAQKIIAARPFYSLNDLLKVSGIGEITLQKIIEQGCAYIDFVPIVGGGGGGGNPAISITTYTISNTTISPDGGVDDTTSIDLAFSEEVKADVNIINPSGVKVRDLYSSSGVTNPDPKIWDGKDNSGAVVPNGVYTILVAISDSAGNSITDTSKTITVAVGNNLPIQSDVTAPQVSFNLDAVQTNLTFPINFTITDPIIGATSPSGIASYVFQWQQAGDSSWQQDPVVQVDGSLSSVSVPRNFTGVDGSTYNFQVQATDSAGNTSIWLPQTPATTKISLAPKILINEIQTWGQTSGDEFVELYNSDTNLNDPPADLSGYSLKKETASGSSSLSDLVSLKSKYFLGKTISPMGYFLITPQTGYLGAATPDLHYSGSSYSIAENNTILLYDNNGNLSDKVGFGSAKDFESQPAANPLKGQSIQRKWDFADNEPQDTANNLADFALGAPTPKAKNNVYSVPPSNDATVTSATYTVSSLVNGSGTITNVPRATSKADFLANLTFATGATADSTSTVNNPVASGDILVVIAQDGATKANYTITADVTAWAQGTIDSFTPSGSFIFHTSDFMPNSQSSCRFDVQTFRDAYPEKNNELGSGGGGSCSSLYPSYSIDISAYKTPGEYDLYLSYCGGGDCSGDDPIGEYYRMYFDGSVWSAVSVDNTKTRLSNDATITSSNYFIVSPLSAIYTKGVLTGGTGTVANVRLGTSKAIFEAAFVPATEATLDFSGVNDPVLTGNTLAATAQNGTTKIIYTITADTITWSQGTINNFTSAGKFSLDTSFFSDDKSTDCNSYFYQSLYPFQANAISAGGSSCNNPNLTPIFPLDLSSLSTVGDYTIWMADTSTGLGQYYEMHFDGSNWSALSPTLNPTLSSDDTVTSATYTVSPLALGIGTITNVPFGTSQADFKNNLTPATGATPDYSVTTDPISTGDTLTVTAQDGATKATYTITVNAGP